MGTVCGQALAMVSAFSWFPWCQYSCQGQVQAAHVASLRVEWGRAPCSCPGVGAGFAEKEKLVWQLEQKLYTRRIDLGMFILENILPRVGRCGGIEN